MENVIPFSICTHVEDVESLKKGDTCFVRWVEDGTASWYMCTVIRKNPLGCCVSCNGAAYEITWRHDEFIATPDHKVVQYIGRYPSSAVVEVGGVKYLVPTADCNFKMVVESINTLRACRTLPPLEIEERWFTFTVEGISKVTKFNKVNFALT